MIIGNRLFDIEDNKDHKCYIMGILNVTPDSFFDGGKWNSLDSARAHVAQMIEEGADIIDVGGESTRPGHEQITNQEEIERVVPYIEMIKKEFDVPVSIDSYKSDVVEEALKAGADLVNDVWGFRYEKFYGDGLTKDSALSVKDNIYNSIMAKSAGKENSSELLSKNSTSDSDIVITKIAQITAKYDVPCCLMHNRPDTDYTNYIEDVIKDLQDSVNIALRAGVSKDKIILDPGIGFAKNLEQNLILTNRLEELIGLGYPVLLATSNKSMIGLSLDLPSDQRVEGTMVTTVMGVMKGASFVRVHNIKENKRAIEMTRAILNEQKSI